MYIIFVVYHGNVFDRIIKNSMKLLEILEEPLKMDVIMLGALIPVSMEVLWIVIILR